MLIKEYTDMNGYKVLQSKRAVRQLIMAVGFFVVVVGGWFYPILGYAMPMCMLIGIGIGLFRGRKWCDWYCPRGSFFDSWLGRVSPQKKIPGFFRRSSVRIGVFLFLMVMMVIQLVRRWPDPAAIGKFFVIMLTITSVVGVILGLVFHQRVWCLLCPVGSAANWVGRARHLLKIDSERCTECGLCYKVCPIQIAPFEFKTDKVEAVRDGDCLKCGLCVAACPQKALSL